MPRQHRHCIYHLQNGCGVSVACARGPFLREDACSPQRPRSRLRPFSAARCSCAPVPNPRPSFPSPLPPAVSACAAAIFFLRLLSSARVVASVAALRASRRTRAPFACERFCGQRDPTGQLRDAAAGHARGGAGTVLRLSGTAIWDGSQVRLPGTAPGYGSQVRLQGTALRYGSQVRLSGTAAD
jgi:hypothetical protein